MTDHNPDEYLPVESAGNVAGISPRTLRYWIKGGKLPATEGQRGKLVRLGDVLELAALTGKSAMLPAMNRQTAGSPDNPARSAGMPAGSDQPIDERPVVSPVAMGQLEAVRDEWLQPLIGQIRELERAGGRKDERIDTLEAQLTEARAEIELLRAISAIDPAPAGNADETAVSPSEAPGREQASHGPETPVHQQSHVAGWLRKLLRRP